MPTHENNEYHNSNDIWISGIYDMFVCNKYSHLGNNPLVCDCQLRWLADYLEVNPVETSEARCDQPSGNQAKKLSQLAKQKFKCEQQGKFNYNQYIYRVKITIISKYFCNF